MLKSYKANEYLLVLLVFTTFLGYIFTSGIIAYGPILLLIFSNVLFYILKPVNIKKGDWFAIFVFIPYVIIAMYNYLISPYDGRYLTTHSIVIVSLVFIVYSLLRLRYYEDEFPYDLFLYKLVSYFVFLQAFICLGQLCYYVFGVGFPISESYKEYFFISGTFSNPNDLAAIVVLVSFVFSAIERDLNKKVVLLVWFLIFTLLIITGSRSALIVISAFFIYSRGFEFKQILGYGIASIFIVFLYSYFISNAVEGPLGRIAERIETIALVASGGISSDSSMSIRSESYLHFLSQLGNLGFGSGKLNDYFIYAEGADFNKDLIFQNPHSLVVEVGYWLGLPGLLSLFFAFFYIFMRYTVSKASLSILMVTSMFISSSVLGNLTYFVFLFICFFCEKRMKV